MELRSSISILSRWLWIGESHIWKLQLRIFQNTNIKSIAYVHWTIYYLTILYINDTHVYNHILDTEDTKPSRTYLVEENKNGQLLNNLINIIPELCQSVLGEQVIIIVVVVYGYLLCARHCAEKTGFTWETLYPYYVTELDFSCLSFTLNHSLGGEMGTW